MEQLKNNELFKMLRLIVARKGLFAIIALLITTAIIAYSYTIPKQYRADTTVFIEKNVINSLVKGLAITPEMGDRIRVLRYALLSRDIVSRVLDEVDSGRPLASNAEKQDYISELRRRTNIQVKTGGGLFIVSLVDGNPQFAKDYLNTLVSTYVQENISAKREESYGASRFLSEQITMFKTKLDKAENSIIDFRRLHEVYLGNEEQSQVANIKGFMTQIDQIDLEMTTLGAKKRLLAKQLQSLDPNVSLFSQKSGADTVMLLEKRLKNLMLTYTDNYPEVVRLKAEIEAFRQYQEGSGDHETASSMEGINPIYQQTMQDKLTLEAEISSLQAKKAKLQQMVHTREAALRDVPEKKKELDRLIQERDSTRKIYEDLLHRYGQSEVSKQMEIGDKTTTFRIVDPAIVPRVPISPDMVKMILLAIAAGFGGGFGLIVLLDKLDNSIKDLAELKTYGVRVLAQIPSIVEPGVAEKVKKKNLAIYSGIAGYYLVVFALIAYEGIFRMNG